MTHHTHIEQAEFKGSTRQAIEDLIDRMDRMESKLDKVIDRNIMISAFTSLFVGIIAAISGFFIRK